MAKKTDEPEIDASKAQRTREQDRAALRRKVEMFYDLQRMRIQAAGRTYKRPDGTEIQLHEIDVAILERRSKELEAAERHALKDVNDHLGTMPFFVNVLSDKVRYRGIGPTMAGVILSNFDIHREDTPSKMWAYCGLRPMPALRCKACNDIVEEKDGEFAHVARRAFKKNPNDLDPKPARSKCNAILNRAALYESGKAQKPVKGEKLPYNARLRSKLCGVLGPVMLKLNSPWRKHYDEYKHRKMTAGWGTSDAHRHSAAIRYMIKMLLLDIWTEWRKAENLPVRESYHIEKQGGHGGTKTLPAPVVPTDEHSDEIEAELALL